MFISIRRYGLQSGDMTELERRVDESFADQLMEQDGFVSYEFVDCGGGQMFTVSMFRDAEGAEASRELAQTWSEEQLRDLEFTRMDALSGQIMVSRAARDMLEPGHVGSGRGWRASMRRYRFEGDVAAMMHIADMEFADKVMELDGFEAYCLCECGGEIVSLTMMRDRAGIDRCDDMARDFVRDHLSDFTIARTDTLTGMIAVSRAMAEMLEPAHA